MFYVIQENLFNEKHYETLLNTMNRFKFEYDIVKYIPFADDIYEWYDSENKPEDFEPKSYQTNHDKVFCFGAVAMAIAAANRGWKPGSMYNENHDFSVYSPKYGMGNMLNGDGHIINFGDAIPFEDEYFFARPTLDSKVFSGKVFSQKAWADYTKQCDDNNVSKVITAETQILVSPAKHIQQEVRCWAVGGKIVTASSYKIGSRVVYTNYDDESYFIDFAQKMIDIYQPAEAFVIDIALANDELSIIEINSINSAGFYECNIIKLIEALENHFN
jgi:hypothetical protein